MKLWAVFSFVLVIGLVSSRALAQQTSSAGGISTASIATETSLLPSLDPIQLTLKAGLKSTSDSGRFVEYGDPAGRSFRLWNEYFVGGTHRSGWGLTAMAVTSGKTFADSNQNSKFVPADPSLTLEHPALVDDGTSKVWGQLRRYFAVSDYSTSHNLTHWAYYLYASRKLAGRAEIKNSLIGRAFVQPSYQPSNTKWVIEDYTNYKKELNSWLKVGVEQHAQFEWHDQTPTGQYVEVYPLVDIIVNKNAFFEPRLVMPVYKVNEVYDSAKNVGLNGSQAELFFVMSI